MFGILVRSSTVPSSPSRSPRLRASLRARPDAPSSSIAEGESLPPSYTPTTMQPVRCLARLSPFRTNSMKRSRRSTLRSAVCSLGDAAREHAKDFAVERRAQHLVFVACVDVRVDVHFDEIDAVLDLLDIGAIKAAADQVRGPYGRVDHLLGCLADGHRDGLALDRVLLALDLDYLPVAGRHEVLGDEERPPIVNANAPVEVAR